VLGTVAVCTLVKGREGHLQALLTGLARSTRLPDRCVVVDMGPSPAALPALPFPILRHHMPSAGLPLAAARNAAARLAATHDLIFLDVDCIPAAGLVSALTADLATADALICCQVLYLAAADRGLDEAAMQARGRPHPVRLFPEAGLRAEPNAGLFWSLAFAIRRAGFDRLGGFDEGYSGYGARIPILRSAPAISACRCCSPAAFEPSTSTMRSMIHRCTISLISSSMRTDSGLCMGSGRWRAGWMHSRRWGWSPPPSARRRCASCARPRPPRSLPRPARRTVATDPGRRHR